MFVTYSRTGSKTTDINKLNNCRTYKITALKLTAILIYRHCGFAVKTSTCDRVFDLVYRIEFYLCLRLLLYLFGPSLSAFILVFAWPISLPLKREWIVLEGFLVHRLLKVHWSIQYLITKGALIYTIFNYIEPIEKRLTEIRRKPKKDFKYLKICSNVNKNLSSDNSIARKIWSCDLAKTRWIFLFWNFSLS